MNGYAARRARQALFLAVVALFLLSPAGEPVALGLTSDCDQICNGGTDCSAPCWHYPPGMPGFEITCGEYEGGALSGYCEGYCGDGYCNGYDNIENIYNCEDDCGSCGDGYCDSSETCSSCGTDCGPCHGGTGQCDPEEPEDAECGPYFCNPSSTCCTGIHVCDPAQQNCAEVGFGCDACAGDEVCRASANGNVWCITAGQDCTLNR